MTNWCVGKLIKEDVLDNQRASYGKQVVKNLAAKLTAKYGNGWGLYKLQHCLRAASVFTEDEIVYALRTQLSWTQLRSLMGLKDALERQFYMQMCALEHWDTRTLDAKIDQLLYQRTAISQKPEELIRLGADKGNTAVKPRHGFSQHIFPGYAWASRYFFRAGA